MTNISATELARNLSAILDRLEHGGEEFVIYRGKHPIARVLPGSPYMTATEAMADLYRTLPPEAAEGWVEESRVPGSIDKEMKDPWDT